MKDQNSFLHIAAIVAMWSALLLHPDISMAQDDGDENANSNTLESISYIDEYGEFQTYTGVAKILTDVEIDESEKLSGWYYIKNNLQRRLEINEDVTIVLGSIVNINGGLKIAKGAKLTIYYQRILDIDPAISITKQELRGTNGTNNAAIEIEGTLVINSGKVNVYCDIQIDEGGSIIGNGGSLYVRNDYGLFIRKAENAQNTSITFNGIAAAIDSIDVNTITLSHEPRFEDYDYGLFVSSTTADKVIIPEGKVFVNSKDIKPNTGEGNFDDLEDDVVFEGVITNKDSIALFSEYLHKGKVSKRVPLTKEIKQLLNRLTAPLIYNGKKQKTYNEEIYNQLVSKLNETGIGSVQIYGMSDEEKSAGLSYSSQSSTYSVNIIPNDDRFGYSFSYDYTVRFSLNGLTTFVSDTITYAVYDTENNYAAVISDFDIKNNITKKFPDNTLRIPAKVSRAFNL